MKKEKDKKADTKEKAPRKTLKERMDDERNAFAESIYQQIQKGEQLPWESGRMSFRPKRLYTNPDGSEFFYHGSNAVRLLMASKARGYTDNRWCTYNQAKALGYPVPKTANGKGVHCAFYAPFKLEKDAKPTDEKTNSESTPAEGKWVRLTPEEEKNRTQIEKEYSVQWFPVRSFILFNAEELVDCPKEVTPKLDSCEKENPYFENMIKNTEALIKHDQLESNFYRPSTDEIHVMPREHFTSLRHYYGTVAHEIAHSTGAANRLNRKGIVEANGFGTKQYAEEEICAEMTAAFLAKEFDVDLPQKYEENHKAYLLNWGAAIKEDPERFFEAVKEARKAADYMKERMLERGMEPYHQFVTAIVPSAEQKKNLENTKKDMENKKKRVPYYKKKITKAKKKESSRSAGR